MHEASILAGLLRRAEEVRRAHGAERVRAIHLRLGEMSGIDPRALEHALTAAQASGLVGDLRLVIERIDAGWWCPRCELRLDPAEGWRCRQCAGPGRFIGGDEMMVTGMDLEMN